VFANINPPLFQLEDLMQAPIKGYFYKDQLTLTEAPYNKKDFFFVEKILHKKIIKGETYYYVKFLYFPKKFNQYVAAKDLSGPRNGS